MSFAGGSAAGARAAEPPPAEADAPERMVDPEARRLFESGLRYFNVGNYAAAIQDFEAAYHRSPVPGLLYNLAQAHRLAGECAPALVLYRRYLASNPAGKNRERTDVRISEMEACVAASRSKADAPDEEASAGPAERAVSAPSLRAAPPAAVVNPAPIAPAPPTSGTHRRTTYALATGGTAVALGAVSGYFGWKAVQAASQTSVGSWQQPWNARAAGIESAGLRNERIAIGTGIAALVAAGVTAWLFLLD
jgi:tetratricopeptide (TPR) repeat protein